MTVDNHLTMQKSNELLQQLSERLTQLEKEISQLRTWVQNPEMIKLVTEKRLLTLEATTKRHEKEILDLKKPQLMYRPPNSEKHQTVAETLDSLHNDIDKLKNRI